MHGDRGVVERHARPTARFEIDPDPRRFRETLERLSGVWLALEPDTARRVRALVVEVIGRSSDHRRPSRGSIRLEFTVLTRLVRIEVSGPDLVMPSQRGKSDRDAERLFPEWAITDLSDRWDVVAHSRDPAVWFEVDRHAAEGLAA